MLGRVDGCEREMENMEKEEKGRRKKEGRKSSVKRRERKN
jgi:hypothetical protein